MRHFEFRDDKSAKFWSIDLQGTRFTVQFGKLGTTGQTQTKDFADEATARKEHDKLVAEKVKKGYVEVGAAAAPGAPAMPTGTAKAAKAPKAAAKAPKAAASKKGARAANPPPPPVPPPTPPSRPVPAGPATTGSADLDGLLAAVRAEPDDDAPRLILAGWLEERGDPRGELIRLQVRIAELQRQWGGRREGPFDPHYGRMGYTSWLKGQLPEYAEMLERVAALLAQHRDEWLARLAKNMPLKKHASDRPRWNDFCFEQGGLGLCLRWDNGEATLTSLDWLEQVAAEPAFLWVTDIELDGWGYSPDGVTRDWDLAAIAAHPGLRRATSLNLSDWQYQIDEVPDYSPLLAESPNLGGLRELDLGCGAEANEIDLAPLWPRFRLPSLRRLVIDGDTGRGAGPDHLRRNFAGLVACDRFPRLEELDACGSAYNDADVRLLAESPHFPTLRRVRLQVGDDDRPTPTPAGVIGLLRSPLRSGLHHVDVRVNISSPSDWTREYIRLLAKTPEARRLRGLDLWCFGLTDEDAAVIAASPHLTNLEFIDVTNNMLSADGVARLRQKFPRVCNVPWGENG
jgi:uncharacterized protein (TIGR02996 family)